MVTTTDRTDNVRRENEQKTFIFYHGGKLQINGEGIIKAKYNGEECPIDKVLEALINDLSSDIPEFNNEECRYGLYFGARWNVDDVGDIMLDYDCDYATDDIIDKINAWLNKEVKVIRLKEVIA